MSEEEKPVKKIKPPSASFLKSRESSPGSDAAGTAGTEVASAPSEEGLLGAPAGEVPDDELFSVPVPEESPPPPAPPAPPPAVSAAPEPEARPAPAVAPEPVRPEGTLAERLAAELRELRDIVQATESLQYLRNRVNRAVEEGADALTLVSFYRLVVRSLAEQGEQSRRDYELMRSRANKLELELAAAIAGGVVVEKEVEKPAAAGMSAEAVERVAHLEQELAQANEQREKLLLDFKNMRERVQKDLTIQIFREKEKFFKNFLPVLDAFERAQGSLNESSSVASLLEGFRLTDNLLTEALTAEGLDSIATDGPFDPRFHEAVGEVENDQKPDGHIFDELSRGYRLGERLIRPAMVRLSRNPNGGPGA